MLIGSKKGGKKMSNCSRDRIKRLKKFHLLGEIIERSQEINENSSIKMPGLLKLKSVDFTFCRGGMANRSQLL